MLFSFVSSAIIGHNSMVGHLDEYPSNSGHGVLKFASFQGALFTGIGFKFGPN